MDGWIATAKSSGKAEEFDEHDELDALEGLSLEQLNSLRHGQAGGFGPATV